ncbi:hypothetical protein J4573_33100 [Actinomadura barringtoniae]|uniref:Guanylate cyclase domain-containing protein n=1 Tax=Actinomadura barringtoniae TaxID=1427535 RepID=A0A939PNS7_9ACTN|nr:hypothetical protein [Actinomadura barringtoniae]MBO2451966.1 hypothetical protein [Actinomadura barringtoniae]
MNGTIAHRQDLSPQAWSSRNCTILYTDVAGFSMPHRTASDREAVRLSLYELLRDALEESGVSWAACYHEDRGDGVLVIVPPEIPTLAVADPFLTILAAALRRYNRRAGAAVAIRMRVALHAGLVSRDAEGLNGDAIIHTARMLDAPPLREALNSTDAHLAFMTSAHVFDTAISGDFGLLDPGSFTEVDFQVKESRITAWMCLPNSKAFVPEPPPPSPPGDGGTHFHGQVHVSGDLVVGTKAAPGT